MLGWLVPLDGPQRGLIFQLSDGTTIIGSGKAAQVRLENDEDIRPEHCRIVATRRHALTGDRFCLVDPHVDGRQVNSYELCDDDVFVVGNTSVVFKTL